MMGAHEIVISKFLHIKFLFSITGEIKVSRTNSLSKAKVRWEVFNSLEELEATSGTVSFEAGETTTTLRLELKQDNVGPIHICFS